MSESCNRITEVKATVGKLEVRQNDYCDEFKQDADRLFYGKECWYCKYGDFGIFTDHPTKNGICKLYEEEKT